MFSVWVDGVKEFFLMSLFVKFKNWLKDHPPNSCKTFSHFLQLFSSAEETKLFVSRQMKW